MDIAPFQMPEPIVTTVFTAGFTPIRAGSLVVRLAQTPREIEESQALRYRVFCEEMGAKPTPEMAALKRDFDQYDSFCDHLLVMDDSGPSEKVVGTYRLLRRQRLPVGGGFYTEGEFNVSALKKLPGEMMELGRSCVEPGYRNRVVMQLLWRGIAAYVGQHQVTIMFGCGSFLGTQIEEHATLLSYLYHYHLAPAELRARALPEYYQPMNYLPKEAIDLKEAFSQLPTLIKGYLRLGGAVGDGAVIDSIYNTTDVCIIVRTATITEHYAKRYSGSLPSQEELPF